MSDLQVLSMFVCFAALGCFLKVIFGYLSEIRAEMEGRMDTLTELVARLGNAHSANSMGCTASHVPEYQRPSSMPVESAGFVIDVAGGTIPSSLSDGTSSDQDSGSPTSLATPSESTQPKRGQMRQPSTFTVENS